MLANLQTYPLEGITLLLTFIEILMARRELLANKCCPLGQQFNINLDECVDLHSNYELETVAEVRARLHGSSFPPWMDSTIILYDASAERPITDKSVGFLQNASEDAVLRYNQRPCSRKEAYFIFKPQDFKLLPNGTLQLQVLRLKAGENMPEEQNIFISPDDWCSDRYEYEEPRFVLLTCTCKRVTCVRRCCFSGRDGEVEGDNVYNLGCSNTYPNFYNNNCPFAGNQFSNSETPNGTDCVNTQESITYVQLKNHRPICKEGYQLKKASDNSSSCSEYPGKPEKGNKVGMGVKGPITAVVQSVGCSHNRSELNSTSSQGGNLQQWLQLNGTILVQNSNGVTVRSYTPDEFCINDTLCEEESCNTAFVCKRQPTLNESQDEVHKTHIIVSSVVMSVMIFLLGYRIAFALF